MLGNDTPAPCPAMRFEGTKFVCALVEMADMMSPREGASLRFILGVGFGCDSETDEEVAATERG